MSIVGRGLAWVAVALVSVAVRGQQPTQIVEQAVRTELAADAADHSLWLYYETDRKPSDGVVQWAAETRSGEVDRVLQQDGRQISPEEQRSRMDRFIQDASAQAKQRRSGQHDDERATQMLSMLPKAFIWTIVKQEGVKQEGGTTELHFRPDPNFHPPTWESRVFAAMEGDMSVDDKDHRIVSLRGKLISPVRFGWGILGELEPGGTFDVERRELTPGVWQITETHIHLEGHAIVFHSISDQEDDVKSKLQQLPANITLEQAEQKLIAEQ